MFNFCLRKQKAKLTILLVSLFFCSTAIAGADSYIVVDVGTDRVLAQKQPFQRWYPASLTKLMTAYIAFHALRDGQFVVSSPVYISEHAKAVAPVKSRYKAGESIPFVTALQFLLVHSTNDLAIALAETIEGSEAAFVDRMNDVARKLGMERSHFMNVHGLFNKDHYSTAYDIALLSVKLRQDFPQYAHFFKIDGLEITDKDKIVKNSNNLLGRFPGADGLKTGFTCASGYNLSASATRERRNIIAVVLGAETIEDREVLTAKLLSQGFNTKGSFFQTLWTLKPDNEEKLNNVKDMRPFACGAEARKRNYPYIKEKEKVVFPSPYLAPVPKLSNIIQVRNFVKSKK